MQTLCKKTDSGESGCNLSIAPVRNGSTTSPNTLEKCSKVSTCDKMNKNENKQSLSEVGDKINTNVNVQNTESGNSVVSDNIVTESKTGSKRCIANNTSLLSKPVTQSSDNLRDQSFGAVADSSLQKTVPHEKLEYSEINKVTDSEKNTETPHDSSDLENMDLKGLEHSSCVGDPNRFESASLIQEKGLAELVMKKGIADMVRKKGLGEMVKDEKDVNSNTSNALCNS